MNMATCKLTFKSEEPGGYCCEFVEKPAIYLQVECPMCLKILRNPYLISCCGNYFCKVCIQRLKIIRSEIKTCPTCKSQAFTVVPNRGHQRMLNGFIVRCSNEKDGCKWTGELGSLDDHLNVNPQLDKQLKGCGYTEVHCGYCVDLFKRIEIDEHQKNHCPKRPFTCEYCLTYNTHYDIVVNNHWPVCGSKPVPCPNKCGENPFRKDLDNHVADDCPLSLVDCECPGCEMKIPRKDMPEHRQKEQMKHIFLLAGHVTSLTKSNRDLTKCCRELEGQNKTLKEQVAELEVKETKVRKRLSFLELSEGTHFTMVNISQCQRLCQSQRFEPFYTHYHGYKMYFEAGFNNGHFAVRVFLMQGEFDDDLKWPVKGWFEVHVKNCRERIYDKNLMTIVFWERRPTQHPRVYLNEDCTYTACIHKNIPSDYTANDCLYLRIKFFFD